MKVLAGLLKEKIKVRLVTEAMIPEYVQRTNCALIGADAVLKNSTVANKTGSLLLALACSQFKKPLYVLADKSKFKKNNAYSQPAQNKKEIWKYDHPNLSIENLYFEKIPNKLITKIISE